MVDNPFPEDDLWTLLYTTPLTLDGENFNVDWRIESFSNGYNNTGPITGVVADGAASTYAGDILFYYRLSFDKKNYTWDQYKGRLQIRGHLSKQ